MRSFSTLLVSALAAASVSRARKQRNCPTITTTATRCSTCPVEDCIILSTISNPRSCPPTIPTRTISFPCNSGGCGGGCSTQYVYPSSSTTVTKSCPTVTSTLGRCATCVVPLCVLRSTISSQTGCPASVPTVFTNFGCNDPTPCPGGCASTEYVYVTEGPTSTPTVTAACTPTVTVTTYPGTSGGCKFNCANDFCIRDEILTLPCGCTRAASVVTKTETICPTSSPCYNCHTGFTFTTTATNCPSLPTCH